ncbi:clcC, partial [Symbiodinium microadriaticum]
MVTQDLDDWNTVCNGLRETEENALWLDVLEAAYGVKDCHQALHAMPDFLGRFLVRDFDYKGFRRVLGHEVSDDGDEEFGAQLDADLQAATTLMLRLVMTIAKSQALEPADWQEASAACGKAVRTLPSCYRLQRQLPGALNDARTLRHLEEGQSLFEGRHGIAWNDVQALL